MNSPLAPNLVNGVSRQERRQNPLSPGRPPLGHRSLLGGAERDADEVGPGLGVL